MKTYTLYLISSGEEDILAELTTTDPNAMLDPGNGNLLLMNEKDYKKAFGHKPNED